MKPTRYLACLAPFFCAFSAPTAHAANGTWSTDIAGNWSDATKWATSSIADGTDAIADFSTLNIAAGRTVTLDSNRTVGTLKFDDTGATGDSGWTISTTTAKTLTLATSSGVPTITIGSTGVANSFAGQTISTAIVGTQGLTVSGGNQLTLGGDLSGLSGALIVNGGRLSFNAGTSLGGITSVTVASGGQLGFWNSGSYSSANITIAGTGYGETGFDAALRLGNASCNVVLDGTVTLSGNATIAGRNGAGFTNTFNGNIGDSGSPYTLTFGTSSLNGTYVLNGTNTYTGGTIITNGTLQIGGAGSLGSGNYAATIGNAGNFRYSSSANQTLAGIISGAGALAKDTDTSSALTLSGVNTYTGATTISAGVLR
ncbi:MAG: autotransporter-associated beta strand repeat-containing protein, partial [Luteolibacter sp.]